MLYQGLVFVYLFNIYKTNPRTKLHRFGTNIFQCDSKIPNYFIKIKAKYNNERSIFEAEPLKVIDNNF